MGVFKWLLKGLIYGQNPTRTIGTECCATRDDAIYDRSSFIFPCTTSTSRCPARASLCRARQSLRPKRRRKRRKKKKKKTKKKKKKKKIRISSTYASKSAQAAHQTTETQEAMDQHYKAKWRQAEADLQTLCQSNSAQAQSFASKLQETNLEH